MFRFPAFGSISWIILSTEASEFLGTMTLSCAFFLCYLMLAISKTYTQFTGGTTGTSKFEKVVTMAANTMAMAPMLSVTFLASPRCGVVLSTGA